MALPDEFAQVTVAGTYTTLDGTAAQGSVTFTAPTVLSASESDVMIVPKPFTVALDENGSFTVVLPATNDPDVSPTFTYEVLEVFTSAANVKSRSYNIEIPFDTVGTLQLADVAPAGDVIPGAAYLTRTSGDGLYVSSAGTSEFGLGLLTLTDAAAARDMLVTTVTAGGPPSRGSHAVGDTALDRRGGQWACRVAGSPGTWAKDGLDVSPAPFDAMLPGLSGTSTRKVPGVASGNGAMTNNRLVACAMPISEYVNIDSVHYTITTQGETGSIIRVGIYADNNGFPGQLLTQASGVADSTGTKQVTLPQSIAGGRWVWVALCLQNAPTTPAQTTRINASPYQPLHNSTSGTDATYFAPFASSVSGSLPSFWPNAWGYVSEITNSAPFFQLRLTARLTPPTNVPDRSIVLHPTQSWEESAVQEPSIYWDGSQWVLVYSGGWSTERVGWATAPNIDGPWTKHGKITALDGVTTGRSSLLYEGGVLYVYYNATGTGLGVMHGADPTSLGSAATALAIPAGSTDVQNSCVIKDGPTYRMIFESKETASGKWKLGYATASSPAGPFTVNTWPLTTLPPVSGGNSGGPSLVKVGSTYVLWFHAGPTGSALPTDIYSATSTDCITWTTNPTPVIRRAPFDDQAADPFLVTDPATSTIYCFWAGLNNSGATGVASIYRSNPQTFPITLP